MEKVNAHVYVPLLSQQQWAVRAGGTAELSMESFGKCTILVRLLQEAKVVPHICKVQYYKSKIFGIGYPTGFYP